MKWNDVKLEVGKVYYLKVKEDYYMTTSETSNWLFKKSKPTCNHDKITTCSLCICLDDKYIGTHCGRICNDDEVLLIKRADANHLAIWNRTLNDNVEIE